MHFFSVTCKPLSCPRYMKRQKGIVFWVALGNFLLGGLLSNAQLPDSLQKGWNKLKPQERLEEIIERADEFSRGQSGLALQLLETALHLADSLKNTKQQIIVRNDLASLLLQQEEMVQAQQYLEEAISLHKVSQLDTLLIDTYTLMGISFERTGKLDEALDYLRKAGVLQQKLKLGAEARARNLTNIGHVYEARNQFEKAIETYKLAYKLCKDNGVFFGEALLSQNLANAHNALGKFNESIQYSNQSLAIAKEKNLTRIETATYQNLGASYMGQGMWEETIINYEKALEIAKEIGYTKAILDATLQLSKGYEAMANNTAALRFFKEHTRIKDSVFSAEKSDKIESLQAAFQSEQKEAAIRELEQENRVSKLKQQRTNLIWGLMLAVVALGSWVLWYRQRQQRLANEQRLAVEALEKEKEKQALEKDKIQYELNALKSQMNPHFLFNALNGIQELFLTGQTRQANEYLGKFSDLTRAILQASGNEHICLDEEISMLKDYLDLEALRFDGDITYDILLDDSCKYGGYSIPPMLIQPYVENAIRHGLMHKTENRHVSVSFGMITDDLIEVTIRDNGIGRQKAGHYASLRHDKHNGFASTATQKRLDLLNHGRAGEITVQYEDMLDKDEPAGTKVIIKIPVKNG
jgi:two-component system, LytTR family, sensor kinase